MELPDPSTISVLALDTETYDPDLKTEGAGFVYKKAHVVGVSIATDSGHYGYYPLTHSSDNVQMPVRMWLRTVLSNPELVVVFANARYDVEALWSMGVSIQAKIVDIQVNEALLDENQVSYSLESISKRRGFEGKNKAELEAALPKNKKGEPDYTRIREVSPKIVGPYAECDALLTLGIYFQQLVEIARDDLQVVADIESQLVPIIMEMRIEGIPVDLDEAEKANKALHNHNEELLRKIREEVPGINPFSSLQLGETFAARGIIVPQTEKGNDSVSNEFLFSLKDPVAQMLGTYRQYEKIRRDFIESMVLEGSFEGRLHPQWYQTRGSSFMSDDDVGGTRSGRLACMKPNLAQIPARHPVLGPIVRRLFRAYQKWLKADYNQQEPRIGLHFAYILKLTGAAEMREAYVNDPTLDYHQIVTDWVNKLRRSPINRRAGKDINLGLYYGMGRRKMSTRLGLTLSESDSIIADYHRAIPFMKPLQQKAMDLAASRGYVKTIMGRRRHFDEWEPPVFRRGAFPIKGRAAAMAKYGSVRLAGLHRALNSVIQGSAAEQCKKAMIELHKNKYKMMVTLYDELGVSVEGTEREKAEVKEIMETAIPFQVPHFIDPKVGDSWGEASYGKAT